MTVMGIWKQYLDRPTDTQQDFDDVARQQPSSALAVELATEAQRHDPGAQDPVAALHAEHPEVVKVLGGAVLAIALGQVATRMRR